MDSNREISATKVWRKRSWREKEINKLRERRRRAVTTKIFSGLRAEGNYNLSKYCGNFEILIALCKEAGWVVEEDGTTYRKVYKSALNNDASSSTKTTHFSSYQNPSPTFSFFPTPIPSYQFNPLSYPPMQISNNAPVTPSLHSPASTNLKPIPTWDSISKESIMAFSNYFQTNSDEWIKFQPYAQSSFAMPSSSSFNVVADNSIRENMGSSNMLEGEKIHDEGLDDLVELRLGTGKGPTSRNLKPIPTWDSISEESIMAFSNYFQTNSDQWIKFQPSAQSSFAMLSSSSFNDVADNSIRENMGSSSMFGEQVKSCVGEKVDDEGIDDLVELRLGIGKGKN